MSSAGKDFLLKQEDPNTPGTFNTVGGLRATSLSFTAEGIEKTNVGSNQWRELIDAAGIKSLSISGSGVFTDSATEEQFQVDAFAQTLRRYQVIDPVSGKYFQAYFKATGFELAGEYNAEKTWSLTLESSGEITRGP